MDAPSQPDHIHKSISVFACANFLIYTENNCLMSIEMMRTVQQYPCDVSMRMEIVHWESDSDAIEVENRAQRNYISLWAYHKFICVIRSNTHTAHFWSVYISEFIRLISKCTQTNLQVHLARLSIVTIFGI